METKQLVEKFINGEITEEQFNDETSKMTPEEQENLKKEAEAKLPDAVEKLKSVRRGIGKVTEKARTPDSESLIEQQRKENMEEAKSKFFSEFGIDKEEDRKAFEEGFKSDSINVNNIIKDMKAHYVSRNPDEFLSLKKRQQELERAAEEENAQNAGANGSGGGDDPTKKVSKEVKDYMEMSRKAGRPVTPEFAEKALSILKNKGRIQ